MSKQIKDIELRELKTRIRKEMISLRKTISFEDVKNKSKIITKKLMDFDKFQEAKLLMSYMSFDNEVCTKDLITSCIGKDKRIAIPLTIKGDWVNRHILPCEIYDIETGLMPGPYGILEPKRPLQIVPLEEIEIVIVPGLAFDIKRNRIGFGAGYYDKFLKTLKPECLKIGLAFDFQITGELPTNEYDVTLDIIFTENRII